MAGNGGGFDDDDPLGPGGCYSHLIFAEEIQSLETEPCSFGFITSDTNDIDSSSTIINTKSPTMLCFGDYANNNQSNGRSIVTENSVQPACTGSASVSSSNSRKITALPKSSKKRSGSGREWVQNPGAPPGSQRSGKRSKSDNSIVNGGHAKGAKKEKLGERVAALQQLVSPFGKTDTASVLHEALGYIRFLQDQVQVLCSPYLQSLPPSSAAGSAPHTHGNGESKEVEERKDDLRSRGLCLVPMELTSHVADSNGADLWSSAAMTNNI